MTEKKYKAKFYRGVHPRVKNEVKKLARAFFVPADDIALVFFQAAIEAVETEVLELDPRPTSGRMTLFPEDEKPGWRYTQTPLLPAEASPIINPALIERKLWQFSVTYRIPEDIHEKIIAIADENLVSIGSVASYFLQWGLERYHAGGLELTPRALTIKQSLIFRGTSA